SDVFSSDLVHFLSRHFFRKEKNMEKGIEYLRKKLNRYRSGAKKRNEIYNMKDRDFSLGITIPPHIRNQSRATLGWRAKTIERVADRFVFREFVGGNFDLKGMFSMKSGDVLFGDAILAALLSSCSFGYI